MPAANDAASSRVAAIARSAAVARTTAGAALLLVICTVSVAVGYCTYVTRIRFESGSVLSEECQVIATRETKLDTGCGWKTTSAGCLPEVQVRLAFGNDTRWARQFRSVWASCLMEAAPWSSTETLEETTAEYLRQFRLGDEVTCYVFTDDGSVKLDRGIPCMADQWAGAVCLMGVIPCVFGFPSFLYWCFYIVPSRHRVTMTTAEDAQDAENLLPRDEALEGAAGTTDHRCVCPPSRSFNSKHKL
eukprot:TRINITY_DN43650_c0_g1_i1.p1 TRINITY_DN43650_c0_g1~~TRINITY_DN43650_c0_g1_i1.p1  ORF type:complete len:246 (-),score=35.25 TRINITY_DN43650_c0_g1_i1:136-873(-)